MDSFQYNVQKNTIELSKKYQWNIKLAQHLIIVGSTGTGKTNIMKYIILKFLNLDKKNDLCIIDGKKGFLYFLFIIFLIRITVHMIQILQLNYYPI
ncbi:helicase HerA domain-containing protein [Helcococcus bovis]|uniref:helicase HerA domain-containing protein n=1 Tax=Helcococcus bovis TaxID=3153252 RepID=UPI0038B857E2